MYEIEGWTNNAGSGDLNYYNLYNNPAEDGFEEALNYVPPSGTIIIRNKIFRCI
jgi:hypothetical protein